MRVARLIEILGDMDPDATVFVRDGGHTWDSELDDVTDNPLGHVFLEATGAPHVDEGDEADEVEALRMMAFPGFPEYEDVCRVGKRDPREDVAWWCTRHPGHEGPHMATFLDESEGVEVVGYAWEGQP